ncbi:MAG: lipoate--protein ligase family protein [bacterium]
MKVRLLTAEYLDNPRLSLATEEAIFNGVIRGTSPPTVWIWRHEKAAVVGRFQIPEEELNLDYAKNNRITVAKRMTGGGAIYQDLGNLIFSIYIHDYFNIENNFVLFYKKLLSPLVNKLQKSGVNAESPGLNDITVNGKKILGSAGTISSSTLLFHATMLVKSDLNALASVLKVPRQKLQDKGVASVAHRVTNLYEESGIGILDATNIVLDSYSENLKLDYEKGNLTEEEKQEAKNLYLKKYNTDSWIYNREI